MYTLNFFDAIGDFFLNIIYFIGNIINSLLNAVLFLAYAPGIVTYLVGFVPSIIGTSLLLVLSIGVVKLVLGWGNSQ